jgi:hypothetical protein
MPTTFTSALSGNYKTMMARHRGWRCGVLTNGESWPRVIGSTLTSTADIYRLGIIPTFVLTAPSTDTGTSTPGIYGIALVYRSTAFTDGFTGDYIQSNRSNIVDVDLSAGSLAAVLTKVTTTDTKINALDIYAAQKIGSIYGEFYRVVKDAANSAGTVTFSIVMSNTFPTGVGVTNGTADTTDFILADDNDYPQAQPIALEVNGRLVLLGGITKVVTATFTNSSSTVTVSGADSTSTFYDGIEFWNIKRSDDTSGGIDGKGTYLCRYASATSVTLVNIDGTAATYSGTSGSGTTTTWTEPNRKFSKLLNPHAFPADNVSNDYPSAILAASKMPNTNRVLIMGRDWTIAEDYDRLPLSDGLNYISTEYGCSSPFSIVGAHGRLYWLDFGAGKREICISDGSSVQPISTKKIKTILERLTLDENGDVWRVGFIHGCYFQKEDTIRWGLYLDNNTLANYVLEFDLNTGDARLDPQYYAHRYLDVFTYGSIRGRQFIGQFGWTGGIARIGLDNVEGRFRDWVPSGTLQGDLDALGQTTSVFTITGAAFATSGDGLKGVQVMIWQESDSNGDLIVNPTYYHCRISDNTADTLTINYVETLNATGQPTQSPPQTDVALPETPSGTGWKFAVGVIQAIIGPKWFTSSDLKSPIAFREIAITHQGYDVVANPIKVHGHEALDDQPRDVQYVEAVQQGEQIADTDLGAHSRALPTTNPATSIGFTIVDNNTNTDTFSLNIEAVTLDINDATEQDDASK